MGLTGVALLVPDTSDTIELTANQLQLFQVSPDGTRKPLQIDTSHLLSDNLTGDKDDMLLWELEECSQALLEISLPEPTPLGGVSIWNYNFTPEDSYAGVMRMEILLDDTELWHEPLTLRKAPDHLRFQFGQEIVFSDTSPLPSPPDHGVIPPADPSEVAPFLALLLDQSHFSNSRDSSRAQSAVMAVGDPIKRPLTSLTGANS